MHLYLAARILAVLSVAGATHLLRPRVLLFVTIAAAFSHYVGALLFSKERVRWFARTPTGWALGAAVLSTGILVTRTGFPHWAVYGILHYLAGDVSAARLARSEEPPDFWLSYWGRFIVNLCGAAVVFRHELGVPGIFPAVLWVGSWLFFGPALWRYKAAASPAEWGNLVAYEALIVGIAVLSLFHPVTFPQASLAHFIFWAILPAGRLSARGPAPVARFVGTLLGMGGLVYLLSPEGALDVGMSTSAWNQLWAYGSNLHITASLAMTAAVQTQLTRLPSAEGEAAELPSLSPRSKVTSLSQ